MPKPSTLFACQECGATAARWSGKCPSCKAWNTLVEEAPPPAGNGGGDRPALRSGGARPLSQIEGTDEPRFPSGVREIDGLLGGGIVPGSSILMGGEPGIGKSTLLLQLCGALAGARRKVLYVTGEESAAQVKLRAGRLGLGDSPMLLAAECDANAITGMIARERPVLAVVDSIQTAFLSALGSAPGSVSQVRECAAHAIYAGKECSTATVLVGHVTKDGAIAGPKTLEHMVDVVLSFEGDRFQSHRILRAVKNRFGATNTLALFEMANEGLRAVDNPSRFFLSEEAGSRPGCAVVPVAEGNRTLLVEIQALTAPSHYGTPERRATGFDYNRLCMILAILERRGGLSLGNQDVFVNAVGGIEVSEPAADLAVALAVASSLLERPLPARAVAFGELGLSGEVRTVPQSDARLAEAAHLGFSAAVVPKGTKQGKRKLDLSEAALLADALRLLR